tara:strand:+ start:79 stop:393 length:315 start_codon:yes stop_codon:yes gene_type:complete
MGALGRKGGFNLSVTALVVIIFAIVTLALLIGFIRGSFSKESKAFEEQIEQRSPLMSPLPNDPLVISNEVVIARPGDTFTMHIGALNVDNEDWVDAEPVITCNS